MTEKQRTILLVVFDFLTATITWFLFYVYRITEIENAELTFKEGFFNGIIIVPLFWMFLYALQGTYHNVLRNYRLKTIKHTLFGTIIGVIIAF